MRSSFVVGIVVSLLCGATLHAQSLDQRLLKESPAALADAARDLGDPKRGAVLFYQQYMACTKCHAVGDDRESLGPSLTTPDPKATAEHLIESVLDPSKKIKKGFDTVSVITADGKSLTGLLVERSDKQLVLREVSDPPRLVTLAIDDIDEVTTSPKSIMPAGQVNQLASRQQFLDLAAYLIEIKRNGLARARELEPPPSLYAARPLPEYEQHIDHAGMIGDLDQASFKRGEAIYNRLCINCHGTHSKPGSLPTSLRFATGKFKNGNDPYTMYQTLTRGFGMMVAQGWMVPQQKYDVIHYIRAAYLKKDNPTQHFDVTEDYLAGLPAGDTRGPEPSNILPWEQMDYGPNLIATYEVGDDGSNFAYKGNAVRLDAGPGGVSRGSRWLLFDYDTLRVAAAWSGTGFIDWNGINFNGRHGIHPRVVGDVAFQNPTGPGWAHPDTGSFEDVRLVGRDKRRYGPLPREWAHYKGMHYHGNRVVITYTVGNTEVSETPSVDELATGPRFRRHFKIGRRDRDMVVRVARGPEGGQLQVLRSEPKNQVVLFGGTGDDDSVAGETVNFDGSTHLEVARPDDFELTSGDYTIAARIKTTKGGTIFCKTSRGAEWVPGGKTLFVRGGRLCFDIGWVGVVRSKQRVADGQWHDVAMTYEHEEAVVRLYVDGELDGQGELRPKRALDEPVVRIGFTAPDFPGQQTHFIGEIDHVSFHADRLNGGELVSGESTRSIVGRWKLSEGADHVVDQTQQQHTAKVIRGTSRPTASRPLLAGVEGAAGGAQWQTAENGDLRLRIPAGDDELAFTLWTTSVPSEATSEELVAGLPEQSAPVAIGRLTEGGAPRWPEKLVTTPQLGDDNGPFAVDVLTDPVDNPWFARLRLTGFDFYPDGDRAVVSAWDGSVWLVSGFNGLGSTEASRGQLTWRRIASGLFQPLGVKIVDGKAFVTCRDQICILHDLNGDTEIDYFESFNNDHQVTDHFHEFAMGLQTDDAGNFYYAKSARHALTALVPHHGTLLRVTPDGSRTDIVANGFRAANGVCVNPDGTFIVTDQEGHWNPKNRINWVREGGFYGNMFGYHDVEDSSDEAMDQPLCWITNAFDRSPSELLWIDSQKWGPLNGSLLNFSYGYGKVYIVPHEEVDGQMQGGMCELPLAQFPTGTMRGRFHPIDGQLYTCGMFAWAGSQHRPGGFYRIRYTGQPVHLPVGLRATKRGVELTFSGQFDPATASNPDNYQVKVWSLKRTANYGSKHYDERPLDVTTASLADDGSTVVLRIPKIAPTWCMEIKYSVKTRDGQPLRGTIHNTIHHLGD